MRRANGCDIRTVLLGSRPCTYWSRARRLAPAYDRLFGIVQVTTTDAIAAVHVGRHRLVFSTPDDFQTMHPALDLPRDFALPGIVALEIGVERREATAAYFTAHLIGFTEMPAAASPSRHNRRMVRS